MVEAKVAHVDIGNQIDNSWNKDSALAIKIGSIGFSIKIRGQHKQKIKQKFIKLSKDRKIKRKNRRVAVIVHSFLLFKLLEKYQDICDTAIVCGDMGAFAYLNKYYSKICKYYSSRPNVKLKPRKPNGKSKAHRLANKVYRGNKEAGVLIKTTHMDDIIKMIETILE